MVMEQAARGQVVREAAWVSDRVVALARVPVSDQVLAMAQVVVKDWVLAMARFAKGQALTD